MYSIVVGLGNPIAGDDAVGLEVAKRLKGKINADVKLSMAGGLELAEMIYGYKLAVIVDSIKGMEGVNEIDVHEYKESVANHDIAFPKAYIMLKRYVEMPKVRIIGIGIKKVEFKEGLSNEIKKRIEEAVNKVKEILEEENE